MAQSYLLHTLYKPLDGDVAVGDLEGTAVSDNNGVDIYTVLANLSSHVGVEVTWRDNIPAISLTPAASHIA